MAEEFAEGLEVPVIDTAPVVDSTPAPVDVAPQSDFMSQFREIMEVPEDATRDSLADYLESVQSRADKAATLEKQVAEYEARMAQLAPQLNQYQQWQTEQQQAAQQAALAAQIKKETPVERKRRYETVQIDDALRPFLASDYATRDPNTGYYQPTKMIPQVIAACDAKNRQLQQNQQVAENLTSDFYGTVDEGVQHSPAFRQLQNEFAEYKQAMEQRFQPIQQHTQQQALDAYVAANVDILARPSAADPNQVEWSPAGQLFNQLLASGRHTAEEAMAIVRPLAASMAPTPAPVAPIVQVPAPKAKPRVIDKIAKRMQTNGVRPAERGPQDAFSVENANFRPTWADVKRRVKESVEE